jgi:Ca2+-binding EF-hand superfamily protein
MRFNLPIMVQVATMLGSMLTKEEVDEFMREADVVRLHLFHLSSYIELVEDSFL